VQPNDDFLSAPKLDYDGFVAALRENFGCFSPARGTNIFAGRVRPRRVFGFAAVDLACDTVRVDRTKLDIRRDDMEYYFVVAQLTGGSTIIQNDRVVNAAAGELVLLDSTRPVTLVGVRQAQWLGLQLPRQNLVSHLGFEPQGGTCGRGQGQAARILSQLALDPVSNVEPAVASADDYMRLVVYDLLGALFAPPAPLGSRHNDMLFMRVCRIIKEPLCRSGHVSTRGGCRGGNFATLFAEAVHGPRVDVQSPHMFGPSGSCGASDRTPRVDEDRSASQRYRLRLRLSRLHVFCARISTAFRHRTGRRRSSDPGKDNARVRADIGQSRKALRSDAISAPFGQREPTQQWATIPKVKNRPMRASWSRSVAPLPPQADNFHKQGQCPLWVQAV